MRASPEIRHQNSFQRKREVISFFQLHAKFHDTPFRRLHKPKRECLDNMFHSSLQKFKICIPVYIPSIHRPCIARL